MVEENDFYSQIESEAPEKKEKKKSTGDKGVKVPTPKAEVVNYKAKYTRTKKELDMLKNKIKKEKKKVSDKKKRELRKKTIKAKKAQLAKENEEGCKGLVPGMSVAANKSSPSAPKM